MGTNLESGPKKNPKGRGVILASGNEYNRRAHLAPPTSHHVRSKYGH
jgi:hypothetical protein